MAFIFDDEESREAAAAERRRISRAITQRFTPVVAVPAAESTAPSLNRLKVIRPLEDPCRNCMMREPIGISQYCAKCIEIKARNSEPAPPAARGAWYVIAISVAVFLLYCAFSGLLDAPKTNDFQRPVLKTIDKNKK